MSIRDLRFRHPRRWLLAWWLWFAILFVLSSIPGQYFGLQPFDWFDKLEHAGFFGLGGLILGGWLIAARRWPAHWWMLPLVAAVVGAIDEIHQFFTPGRSGLDLGDWIADIVGGSLAAVIVHLMYKRFSPLTPP